VCYNLMVSIFTRTSNEIYKKKGSIEQI